MKFVALDFETSTKERHSACEIGLTIVENGEIIDVIGKLIKPTTYPDWDNFLSSIHGIKPKDVVDAPDFPEIWQEYEPILNKYPIVAHNASYDMSVLRAVLDYYRLRYPVNDYYCSYFIAKNHFKGIGSYRLDILCKMLDIPLTHHRAANDSEATAKLFLEITNQLGVSNISQLSDILPLNVGRIDPDGYSPCGVVRGYYSSSDKSEPEYRFNDIEEDPDSPFFNKKVIFTGTLVSMTRSDAKHLVKSLGGKVGGTVTLDTNYLVVGIQQAHLIGDKGKSNKELKAEKLAAEGKPIEVLREDDFLTMIPDLSI